MKILVVPDSFKGSISAVEAASTIRAAIENKWPSMQVTSLPASDGGEGFTEVIKNYVDGDWIDCVTKGPLGAPRKSKFIWSNTYKTAIIEMAEASGLTLIPSVKANPWHTTTYGTGLLMNTALDLGAKKIILTLGGSATNDGGAGALMALGAKISDEKGEPIEFGCRGLDTAHTVDFNSLHPRLASCDLVLATDVDNPLLGEQGATYIYAPQKGASSDELAEMEKSMKNWANLLEKSVGKKMAQTPGAGAAGGLSFGLLSLPKASIMSGFELFAQLTDLNKKIKDANLVISGEGRLDMQSLQGKFIGMLASRCKQQEKPLYIITGQAMDIESLLSTSSITGIQELAFEKDYKSNAINRLADATVELFSRQII